MLRNQPTHHGVLSMAEWKKIVVYILFMPILASLFSGLVPMAQGITEHTDFELRFVGSDAFSDISRMVETDCGNGIDDDGDGLIDTADLEDCG